MPGCIATTMHCSEQQDHLIVRKGGDCEHSCYRRFRLERVRSLRSVWRASLRTITMASGFDLLFCSHHSKEHADKLKQVALTIHDETETIR
jgi:hypothetical protein